MAATDPFTSVVYAPPPSYQHAVAVSPSDSTDLTTVASALYIGTAGALKIVEFKGETVTFGNVGVGVLPIRVSRVWSTGTVASNIVALW